MARRGWTFGQLVAQSKKPGLGAAKESHWEVLSRLKPEAKLAEALNTATNGTVFAGPARTIRMLVAGVTKDLDNLSTLLSDEKLDRYHRELGSIESRYAMLIATVVDLLSAGTEEQGPLFEALELLVESHVGSALLLRHQLQAHAGHLENLPEATKRARRPSAGVVDFAMPLRDMVKDAIRDAAMLAFTDDDVVQNNVPDDKVLGIPHHSAHALLEILKNAVKAHIDAGVSRPVTVDWAAPNLVIRDFGAGLSRDEFRRRARLTPGKRFDRINEQTTYAAVPHPLGGIKIGLFAAKVHANHFLSSSESVEEEENLVIDRCESGTVAELRLPTTLDAVERLPDLDAVIPRLLR